MTIQISSENQHFLDAAVASGTFASRDAAIDRAVSWLRERRDALDRIQRQKVPVPELPPVLLWNEAGQIMINGHRISLYLILERFYAGDSPGEIHAHYPSLEHTDFDHILEYVQTYARELKPYYEQQVEIEQLMYEIGPRGPSLDELKAKWLAMFGRPFESSCR